MQDTIPRVVGLNDVEWLGQPGDYALPSRGINSADRARMSRIAKRNGCTFRSNLDGTGWLLVTIWKGVL